MIKLYMLFNACKNSVAGSVFFFTYKTKLGKKFKQFIDLVCSKTLKLKYVPN